MYCMYFDYYRIAGILRGGGDKIFVIFVVERPTTKFLPTKQYCIVLGCGLVYHDHENFSTNCPKIHCSQKFYPPKNIRHTVVTSSTTCALQLSLQQIHVHGVQAHIQI